MQNNDFQHAKATICLLISHVTETRRQGVNLAENTYTFQVHLNIFAYIHHYSFIHSLQVDCTFIHLFNRLFSFKINCLYTSKSKAYLSLTCTNASTADFFFLTFYANVYSCNLQIAVVFCSYSKSLTICFVVCYVCVCML